MPNHFHLLIQQKTDLPITKLISKICTSYAICFNKNMGELGRFFRDQFKAVLVENNEQLLWTSYYIHKNPTEADIVINLKDYKWGSYSEYFDKENSFKLCKKDIITKQFNSEKQYLKYFDDKENDEMTSLRDFYFDFSED